MACCPFHDDKSPSLKIYPENFYCFGCGETGDATGFVAKLFGISQLEAAKKISYDFGFNLFNGEIAVPIKMTPNSKTEYWRWLRKADYSVSEYLKKLDEWRRKYKPQSPVAPVHSRFIESLQETGYVEYLKEILRYGTEDDKRELFRDNQKEIRKIQERLDRIAVEDRVVKRKVI